jgi:hypothetical protein
MLVASHRNSVQSILFALKTVGTTSYTCLGKSLGRVYLLGVEEARKLGRHGTVVIRSSWWGDDFV